MKQLLIPTLDSALFVIAAASPINVTRIGASLPKLVKLP